MGNARLGCMEHNLWNILRHLILFFPLPLIASFLSISHWSFWMNEFERISEHCLGFHRTCNLWRTSDSAFINSTVKHTFCNCLWMFVSDFFSATRYSVMPIVSYTSHYHAILMTSTNMRENVLFTVLQGQAGHSQLTTEKTEVISCSSACSIETWCKTFWATVVLVRIT